MKNQTQTLLALGLHNHQPVGNFDFIFEEAYQKSYLPFLDVFEPRENLKVTQHFTGILLDWFEKHHPDFIDRLAKLVSAGRVELLGGGYYEPILCMLTGQDQLNQVLALQERIQSRFGVTPRGMWLAERVWEPGLASTIAKAGLEYVLLDDTHFRIAGLTDEQLDGPFVTENQGHQLTVFPISKELRYRIPFQHEDRTVEYLREFGRAGQTNCAVLGDDGEKFGIWPGTHQWVYKEQWLNRFFDRLEAESDWLSVVTLSEAAAQCESRGLVYLPTASYFEMMDWALPWDETQNLEDFRNSLEEETLSRFGHFIKGGFWRSFLSKYRESQHMQRKALYLSQWLNQLPADTPELEQIRHHLWAGECNCGYWHGVFGGIYLNHIRAANYGNLIAAEKQLRKCSDTDEYCCQQLDFFRDGGAAWLVYTPDTHLLFDLQNGGSLVEWDHLSGPFNLLNTLTRRPEAYHRELFRLSDNADQDHASIHDRHTAKEEGLENHLIYDPYRRAGNIPHFFSPDCSLESFRTKPHNDLSAFWKTSFQASMRSSAKPFGFVLEGQDCLVSDQHNIPVQIRQEWTYNKRDKAWRVCYQLTNLGKPSWSGRFGVEFGWSLNAGNTFDRYYLVNGQQPKQAQLASIAEVQGVETVALVEEWWGVMVELTFKKPALLWRFPIETVSNSEGGFERSYQSSVVLPIWEVVLKPNQTVTTELQLSVKNLKNAPFRNQ